MQSCHLQWQVNLMGPTLLCSFFISFLAATKQLYGWSSPSVRLYRLWLNGLYGLYGPRCPLFSKRPINLISLSLVRLSVRLSVTLFLLCSYHRIIMKFSGVITNVRSDVTAKGQGHWSKVKVTEVITQLNRFRTVTQVWIHIWWWNDAQSLMLLRWGALLFFKVTRQISRSHG